MQHDISQGADDCIISPTKIFRCKHINCEQSNDPHRPEHVLGVCKCLNLFFHLAYNISISCLNVTYHFFAHFVSFALVLEVMVFSLSLSFRTNVLYVAVSSVPECQETAASPFSLVSINWSKRSACDPLSNLGRPLFLLH